MRLLPHDRPSAATILLTAPALVAAAIAIAPVGYLIVRATERGTTPITEELRRPQTLDLLQRSLLLTLVVTAACTVIGVAVAWAVALTDVPLRRVFEVALALPLAVPTYVAAYTWLAILPRYEGFRGSTTVLTLCSYPYVYLPVLAAMRRLDPSQAEVARSLGSGPWAVFRRVTWPQLRGATTTGALLVALYVLSDFGAVSLMRYEAFTQAIYLSYVGAFDRTPAAILGCLLALLTAIIVIAEVRTRGHATHAHASSRGARRPMPPARLGWVTAPALAGVLALLAAALGVPGWSLARWSVWSDRASIDWGLLGMTLRSTITVAVLGALANIALAIPVAILVVRRRSRFSSVLEGATYVGHALPGLVIALSLVFFGIRFATPIYQRTPLLVIAYVALFLPLAVGSVRASLAQAPPQLDEVGRSLGAGPLTVLRRIMLPLAAPGIGAGAALVALTCVKELPATLLLRPNGMDTLATRVWTETGVADYARAAPYAIAMVGLGTIAVVLSRQQQRWSA